MSYYRRFPKLYNELAICVDSYNSGQLEGRAYFGGEQEPTLFRDVCPILIGYNEFLDVLGTPQASTEMRTFFPRGKINRWLAKRREVLAMESQGIILDNGEKATFIVHVEYRQNSTWQGKVTWVESGETKHFRSALELMVMMEGALSSQGQAIDNNLAEEA